MEFTERPDGGDDVAGFQAMGYTRGAGTRIAGLTARRRSDAHIETKLLVHCRVGGE